MSREPTASRRSRAFRPLVVHLVAVAVLAVASAYASAAENVPAASEAPAGSATPESGQSVSVVEVSAPLEAIIVTVNVNAAARGTAPILRDQKGRLFVPVTDYRSWELVVPEAALVRLQGIEHVDLGRVPELKARFDEKRVALEITVAPGKLPKNTIDLRWRYPDALRPVQPGAFFNYALSVAGDDSFDSSRTQLTTEVGGRVGDTLFYSSGTYIDQHGDRGYTRLQTNATYDQRDTLQRLIAGDFFTPTRELSASFPMGGVSFSKYYPMDPYFIQYPTLNLNTTAALPSQVEVRIDGNVVTRQQVQPGPIDIVNITGYTGARNVQVTVRDAFGREQVVQQPFYFTDFALKTGLHDYSYNLGFLRENYGVESNDYGTAAFTGFHRYGFTDQLTLGLTGQAREGMVNAGPIGTVLLPGAGIVGAGLSASHGGGTTGHASSFFYSFVAPRFSVSASARYFGSEYRLLPSGGTSEIHKFATASVAYSPTRRGTISTSYTVTEPRELESIYGWNVGYNVSVLGGRGLFTLGYTKNWGLVNEWSGSVSFRYLFARDYSAVATMGRAGSLKSQTVNYEKTVPLGEGFGFSIGPGRAESPEGTTTLANAYGQYNGRYATFLARYQGSSNDRVLPGVAEVTVASGIGYVKDRLFVSRPLTDSFAIVKVGDVPDVPVIANGQLMGTTDERGEVVVSPLFSFFDNYLHFEQRAVPLDYVFNDSRLVMSPAFRSGSYLAFDVKKNRAVIGRLERKVDGRRVPVEFRELKVSRAGVDKAAWEALHGRRFFIQSFTAKGGEFYVEQLEPGEWTLEVEGDPSCIATIKVPQTDAALTELGTVLCAPAGREKATQKP